MTSGGASVTVLFLGSTVDFRSHGQSTEVERDHSTRSNVPDLRLFGARLA